MFKHPPKRQRDKREVLIRQAISKRYQPPEWFLAWEVSVRNRLFTPDDPGYYPEGAKTRIIDALAISPWRRNGYEWHGLEIKVRRSDWLREAKIGMKAIPAVEMCNRWFLVAVGGVVKIDELPATWGLLELRGGKLVTKKVAPLQTGLKIQEPIANFIGNFLTAYHRCLANERHIDDLRHQIRHEEYESAKKDYEYKIKRAEEEADTYRNMQKKLTELTGIDAWDLTDFNVQKTANRIRSALALENADAEVQKARDALVRAIEKLDEIPKAKGRTP